MNERTTLATRLLITHLFIPLIMVLAGPLLKGDLFLFTLITQTVLVITYLTGYWEFTGLKFRLFFFMLLEGLLVAGEILKLKCYHWQNPKLILVIPLGMILLYLLYHLAKILVVISRKDSDAFEILFPFRNGSYLVTDGGNSRISRLMNYHFFSPVHMKNNTNRSMLYATDIVKRPERIRKFMPVRNEEYPVFNDKLYSPMDGTVYKVINGIEDNIPFSGNYPYNTGNTVVIRNDRYFFLLGHLKKDSIIVREGDKIKAGDPIGAAGNSGMSERPHLHMQLMVSEDENYWKGLGINILFKGRNLYKNRVIEV